jgi:hypothetical protein
VFELIIGGDMKTCSDELKHITVRADEKDANGDIVCNEPEIFGETLEGDSDTPTIVLCESGLKHGAIKSSIKDGPKEVNCDNIGNRVTWRMDTLGSTLIHEYTYVTTRRLGPSSATGRERKANM